MLKAMLTPATAWRDAEDSIMLGDAGGHENTKSAPFY